MEQAVQLADVLEQASREVQQAVPRLRELKDISHHTVEIHRLENDGDRITREAMASLFEGGIDPMVVIRWKDIYEKLENAIDATETVANILETIAIKNSLAPAPVVESDIILVIVVGTALAFDFTNGFHDTANVVATSISTRAMAPKVAVGYAAILNFVGAFLSLAVAATIASGIVEPDLITPTVVFAGLVGAITWNLITWYYGLPSSSSHALIGGVVGSAFVAEGADAVIGDGLIGKVAVPGVVAPILAFATAAMAILFAYRIIGRQSPGTVNRGFRVGQIASGGMLALAHGTNDAQKTMGVITLTLIANGSLSSGSDPPTWVIVCSATRDRPGHLRRRLADHPHDGQPHHQDGHRPGLRGAGIRGGGDPRRVARRASRSRRPTRSRAR